ncbi:hypothetical protein Slin15195_G129120 [Septoria linicola]|uniref:Uncharacterized protein n=1 Tax=Septoria linicola TaxID=215465 RepID=A0A9Q9B910_9PEZI|nr:hypothetical protein Slin14017_G121650 [Septoria linicola]USW59593.1 hypothetical protein Slin15195_G129120 [Septoria linicola]
MKPTEMDYTIYQLMLVINRVQRHNCSHEYCQRKNNRTCQRGCRFYFPRTMPHDQPTVDKSLNPRHYMFDAARNDDRMNNYVRAIIAAWLANTDAAVCTDDEGATADYLAKYCSKQEKRSESLLEVGRKIAPYVNAGRPITSFFAKMLNKLVGERDISAQEEMHLLLNLPLA